eukprot:5347603-Amphidinium_carterae.3
MIPVCSNHCQDVCSASGRNANSICSGVLGPIVHKPQDLRWAMFQQSTMYPSTLHCLGIGSMAPNPSNAILGLQSLPHGQTYRSNGDSKRSSGSH